MTPLTPSYNPGHGICCRPDSTSDYCKNHEGYICSDNAFNRDYPGSTCGTILDYRWN